MNNTIRKTQDGKRQSARVGAYAPRSCAILIAITLTIALCAIFAETETVQAQTSTDVYINNETRNWTQQSRNRTETQTRTTTTGGWGGSTYGSYGTWSNTSTTGISGPLNTFGGNTATDFVPQLHRLSNLTAGNNSTIRLTGTLFHENGSWGTVPNNTQGEWTIAANQLSRSRTDTNYQRIWNASPYHGWSATTETLRTQQTTSQAISITGAGNVAISNERATTLPYTMSGGFTMAGSGTITFSANSFANAARYNVATTFQGTTGTLVVGSNANFYTGFDNTNTATTNTATNFGVATGTETAFTATINSGRTWTASGIVNSRGTIGINGGGSFISQSAVNINSGTTTLSGTGTAWGSEGTDYLFQVGVTGTGILTVQDTSSLTTAGQTQIGAAIGNSGTVNLNNSATWTANNTINVGNAAQGTLNINNTATLAATDQTVNIGVSGQGTVNQTDGTWTNQATRVGINAAGTVDQSGGTHTDGFARIGISNTGSYTLSGGGTWITNGNGTSPDDLPQHAIIGVNAAGTGTVTVTETGSAWTISNALTVADAGTGTLNIQDNGTTTVAAGDVIVGNTTASRGTANINTEGVLNVTAGSLTVAANSTQSSMTIETGGVVNVAANSAVIAQAAGSGGTVTVDGTGSQFNVNQSLTVAQSGTGTLNVTAAGVTTVSVGSNIVGEVANSVGVINVRDWGSQLNVFASDADSQQIIGNAGNGTLNITDRGVATLGTTGALRDAIVGQDELTGIGTVHVTGTNRGDDDDSRWVVSGDLTIAQDARGDDREDLGVDYIPSSVAGAVPQFNKPGGLLSISQGGTTTVGGDAYVAHYNASNTDIGSVGVVRVTDPDSLLHIAGDMSVAVEQGTFGFIYVRNQGQILVDGRATVANDPGSRGYILIENPGSNFTASGGMTVGEKGWATVHIRDAGELDVDPSEIYVIATNREARGEVRVEGRVQDNGGWIYTTLETHNDFIIGALGHGRLDVFDYGIVRVVGTFSTALNMGITSDPDGRNVRIDPANPDNGLANENKGTGILNVYDRARLEIFGDHIIGDAANSMGRAYIDNSVMIVRNDRHEANKTGAHWSLDPDDPDYEPVGGTLIVGGDGYAGATYEVNRYAARFGVRDVRVDPNDPGSETLLIGDPGVTRYDEVPYYRDWFQTPDKHYMHLTLDERLDGTYFANDPNFIPGADGYANYATLNYADYNPIDGNRTGNMSGLAITRGGVVESDSGIVGKGTDPTDPGFTEKTGYGYVVIDHLVVNTLGVDGEWYDHETHVRFPYPHQNYTERNSRSNQRTRWEVGEEWGWLPDPTNPGEQVWGLSGGGLTIAENADGFVRVLNGALLQTASLTTNDGIGSGTLHIVGEGALRGGQSYDPPPGYVVDPVSGYLVNELLPGRYLPYRINHAGTEFGTEEHWYRTEWINHGRAILGADGGGNSTIRINAGGYAETRGLYIGLHADSEGAVSVTGAASELHVFKDRDPTWVGVPEGSSLLSVSNYAFVQLHAGSELFLNGNAIFSHGSLLHLDAGAERDADGNRVDMSVLDAMTDRVSFVNSRIEGDGIVSGQKGVFITQDDIFTPEERRSQMTIDPGQVYDWATQDESPDAYGTIIFGDQLYMSGNVLTLFDVNSGMSMPGHERGIDRDSIIVKRGVSPDPTSTTTIVAELSGTLQIHARLTDYYIQESSVRVVETQGDALVGGVFSPGRITSLFDDLEVLPVWFFTGVQQEIRTDEEGNEHLYVNMTRNNAPFSTVGLTHNERALGRGLDGVYADMIAEKEGGYGDLGQDWLPFLRYLWYFDEHQVRNELKHFGGEIRAHSMMLPLRNPWNYIVDRTDLRRDCFFKDNTPCDKAFDNNLGASSSRFKSRFGNAAHNVARRIETGLSGTHIWGNHIRVTDQVDSDGNAAGYRIVRDGLAVGVDYNVHNRNTWVGFMFAYNDGSLRSELGDMSSAKSEDFNFGLYHRTRLRGTWDWNNYLGMGYQRYQMQRSVGFGLTHLDWDEERQYYVNRTERFGGQFQSQFNGYSMGASTELSRPFLLGKNGQWLLRPFMALDMSGFWQGAASEDAESFEEARYAALDYNRTNDVRIYFRPGLHYEYGTRLGSVRGQIAYSLRAGGRGYPSVDNQFQFGGKSFDMRGVDEGSGFMTVNIGSSVFLDKRKTSSAMIDYWMYTSTRYTSQAVQAGVQKQF